MVLLASCLLLLGIAACNSAQKALQSGNYDEAVIKAAEKLRSSPDNEKAALTLRDAYPMAIRWHLDNIGRAKSSSDPFRWEGIHTEYEAVNRLYDEIRRCPACLKQVSPADLRSYVPEAEEANRLAAEARYQAAEALMPQAASDRRIAREAFKSYEQVARRLPNYREVNQRLNDARYYATLKVLVEQIPVHSRAMGLSNEFFQNKIYEYISTNRRMNEFVRFYTPQEAQAERLARPDHVLRLQFDDFMVGQTHTEANTETVTSKDSVQVGKDKEGRPVYNRVTAKLTVNRKVVISKGLLDMQILETASNTVIFQHKMPGEHRWFSEWATFNGDERALTTEQKRLTNNRPANPPLPQDLFIAFCSPIYDQVTYQIRKYYEKY
jgi:hypothetical protein